MRPGQGLCDLLWALPFSGLGSLLVPRAVGSMLPMGVGGVAQWAGMGSGLTFLSCLLPCSPPTPFIPFASTLPLPPAPPGPSAPDAEDEEDYDS